MTGPSDYHFDGYISTSVDWNAAMNTRKIKYIEPDEDLVQKEVDWALSVSMEERLRTFCQHIATNYSLAGIDVYNHPVKKVIYYISENESKQ